MYFCTGKYRLTFPIKDGVLLKPFQLEHGTNLSDHYFQLRDSVHRTLLSRWVNDNTVWVNHSICFWTWRNDLELQFKGYFSDDKQQLCNWPDGISISVNCIILSIDQPTHQGGNKTPHKPLHIKQACQPGKNAIQIATTVDCCVSMCVVPLNFVHGKSICTGQ